MSNLALHSEEAPLHGLIIAVDFLLPLWSNLTILPEVLVLKPPEPELTGKSAGNPGEISPNNDFKRTGFYRHLATRSEFDIFGTRCEYSY